MRDKAGTVGVDRFAERGRGQVALVVVDKIRRAALRRHHTPENLRRLAVVQHLLQLRARFSLIFRKPPGEQHLDAQRHRHFQQTRVAVIAGQEPHRLADFHRVTGAGGQHFVHIGQQCGRAHARTVRHANDRLRQFFRERISRHKCPAAHFHVHHQRVQPFGEFFREDRSGDKRNRIDGRGDITRRIEAFIRRCQRVGLANYRHADVFNNVAKAVVVRENIKPRNRFQFIEGAAGVTQSAPGNHRNVTAAGRDHRAQHQRGHVAHAAGGVFIHDRAVEVQAFPVQHGAGITHRHRQRDSLRHGHVVKENRHRQRGDLAFGHSVIANAVNKKADLFVAERMAVALFTNNFLSEEHGTPRE
ncbi:hypothetical protein BN129_1453 [Cronobacter sakazakii 701]|nr:hypothetical protein BN129_1453 [Cronobacter sakazakii 701]